MNIIGGNGTDRHQFVCLHDRRPSGHRHGNLKVLCGAIETDVTVGIRTMCSYKRVVRPESVLKDGTSPLERPFLFSLGDDCSDTSRGEESRYPRASGSDALGESPLWD